MLTWIDTLLQVDEINNANSNTEIKKKANKPNA